MYNSINENEYEKAGDYILSDVIMVSYNGQEIDISSSVAEINIYESLFNNTLSGNLVLIDAKNLPFEFPITGLERIEFKLTSPGFGDSVGRHYDFTSKSGHPMYIYKITDRQPLNQKTQTYVLNFCSRETIRNEQVRVTRAFTGGNVNMVLEMLRDKNYLDSKKSIFFEESSENQKYVVPNLHPFGAIRRLADITSSLKFKNAGFLFYETASGFKFRSWESILAKSSQRARDPQVKYNFSVSNVLGKDKKKDIWAEMKKCSKFKLLSQQDTIKSIKSGVAASKLLTHDSFNKLFAEHNYDYHLEYEKSFHTEHDGNLNLDDERFILPLTPYDREEYISSMPDSVNYFKSNTKKIHNDNVSPPVENILQKRISQRNALDTIKIEVTVPGFTGISVGEVVTFYAPSVSVQIDRATSNWDKQLTGRYVLSAIRHTVNIHNENHSMSLEMLKDSYSEPLGENAEDNFSTASKDESDSYIDQYTLDEDIG
jgi:hypothetical protein